MCNILKTSCLIFTFIYCPIVCNGQESKKLNLPNTVKMWGSNLGMELKTLAELVTSKNRVVESFKQTKVILENGSKLTEEIADKLRVMMVSKEEALKRVVEKAEILSLNRKMPIYTNSSFDYYDSDNITNSTTNPVIEHQIRIDILKREEHLRYHEEICDNERKINNSNGGNKDRNAHKVVNHFCRTLPDIHYKDGYFRHMPLVYHSHFGVPVNFNFSAMRIAISIYDRDDAILNDVRWSEGLDTVFKQNYKNDPTLKWQYFAGTTGFMRHFPAIQWSDEKYDKIFDFRTRAWYLEAISSPKDVIILLDMSGSMWQSKWITAKFVVNNLLDTLGDNDYVNIYLFNNKTYPLVDCFNYKLMQAHEENLRLLRESLNEHRPFFTGDMSQAFEMAFATLAQYKQVEAKAHCNQIIMLIAEGIDYDYKPAELFQTYNREEPYYTPVRVFTFLIGTVPSDAEQMEWIACANMGYYVNISTAAEIAEKTLKYLTVLSRPLNFNYDVKPEPIWTGTYVDLADRRLTNWLWEKHEGNQQRQIFVDYTREAYEQYNCIIEDPEHFLVKTDHDYAQYLKNQKYTYMTTVSLPVYDRRFDQTAVLGVAGIDLPIELIKRLTMSYKIGVNGYPFILTNNGLLLLHPDHRKEFKNILKPTFNRVDMTEVEIVDDSNEPRDFNKSLLEMRDNIVKQKTGYGRFNVITHLDNMKRAIMSGRHYFYTHIGPFSLVVAFPDKYGFYKVVYEGEKLNEVPNINHLNALRNTKNWRIHPEWLYCKHFGEERLAFQTPEKELLHFFRELGKPGWEWTKYCDSVLVNRFIMDAKATDWFEDYNSDGHNKLDDILNTFQVTIVFLATHTGLTRWRSAGSINNNTADQEFIKKNHKAIDEVWYKRAVEYNYDKPMSFVYSVPFKQGNNNQTLVTASNAIYRESGPRRSPVAVVGFQFDHSTLNSIFNKIVNDCGSQQCHYTCESKDLLCFILDNNAYTILSEEPNEIGTFFGRIRPDMLQLMLEDQIYVETRGFDYQGICYIDPPQPKSRTSPAKAPASRNLTFLDNIINILHWIYTLVTYFMQSFVGAAHTNKNNPCYRAITAEYKKRAIRKTLPTPCDREILFYTLKRNSHTRVNVNKTTPADCHWYYIVQPVTESNLILLVINKACSFKIENYHYTSDPVELKYNMTMPCYIATKNNYTRRQYIACFNKHKREYQLNAKNKKYCGITWPT